ncbi:hypothetical protein ACHAXS_008706 [Conticribra weissflogii]
MCVELNGETQGKRLDIMSTRMCKKNIGIQRDNAIAKETHHLALLLIFSWLSQLVEASIFEPLRPVSLKFFCSAPQNKGRSPILSFLPSFSRPSCRRNKHKFYNDFSVVDSLSSSGFCASRTDKFTVFAAAISSKKSFNRRSRTQKIPNNNQQSSSDDSPSKSDKLAFNEEINKIPIGQLTQQNKTDMLLLMRQLSAMDRRRDDIISSPVFSHARQRRQDATIVERLLERLMQEQEYLFKVDCNDESDTQINSMTRLNVVATVNLAIKAWSNANVRGSAEKAERILNRLLNNHSIDFHPDIYSFAHCYSAWYRESIFAKEEMRDEKTSSTAMKKAEAILQSMKSILMEKEVVHLLRESEDVRKDVNSLLETWTNVYRSYPGLAENFLCFLSVQSGGQENLWIDTRSYNIVINAWAKSGNRNSVKQAESLLSQMEHMDSKVKPNVLSYSGVISCIAQNTQHRMDASHGEEILRRMEVRQENVTGDLKPDNVIYNQVINLYSKSGSEGSAEKAEALLNRMKQIANAGNFRATPDIRSYNLVLSAYANEKGPAEAEMILHRIETNGSIQPNAISYITCMDSYARDGDVHNALRILSMMEKSFNDGNAEAKPTRRAYTSALNALAKSGRGDAGLRAEALVQTMERLYKAGNKDLEPDTTVYNVLINCHKNSSATKAEQVLYRMGKRDVVSYSSVITAYSQKGGIEAAKRAQALLEEMKKEDVEPNAQTFNSAIMAFARSGGNGAAKKAEGLLKKMEELYEGGNGELIPNAILYTSVITAWSKSDEPGSALRAEILLKLMWTMFKRGNVAMKPNVISFTAVIHAWARSGESDAGERAEALVDQMIKLYNEGDEDVKPNVMTLTAAVNAYARNHGRDAASKASKLMKKMEAIGVMPNLQTYNSLISAWGNSKQQGAPMMAESILYKLESTYLDGNHDIKPSVISYTSAINAWAKSLERGKAKKAQAILERMKRNFDSGRINVEPNTVTYTSVINACATTYGDKEEKQEALKIAYSTFKEITNSDSEALRPNHITYSTFLKAVSKLMPGGEKKDAIISAAFRLCIRDGQVDDNCLFQLKSSASPELVSDLLGGADPSETTLQDLPFNWKRNVVCKSISRAK